MKEVKKYDFTTKPSRGNILLYMAAWMLSLPSMKYHHLELKKEGMEGLKAPYLLFSNHQSFYDLKVLQTALFPHRANYVAAIDAFALHGNGIMHGLGCIAKRKFLPMDLALIKNMRYSVDVLKKICVMYPEARFSLDGKRSYIPFSTAKLVKLLKVPLVTLNMHGCYTANPQFSQKKYKHVPIKAEMKLIASAEQVEKMTAEEIYSKIVESLDYDDYDYQLQNNIRITDPDRAKGLGSLLYQCPHCYTEHSMTASGTTLRCEHCGKAYEYTELGELRALDGETEFSHIPDWFDWQRENVRKEVASGKYHFEDEVEVWTLPSSKKFVKHGKGKIVHTLDGFRLVCEAYGQPTDVFWKSEDTYGLHIEYNFRDKADVIDISKMNESFWLYPTKKCVITKLSLAFEEIFKLRSKNDLLR